MKLPLFLTILTTTLLGTFAYGGSDFKSFKTVEDVQVAPLFRDTELQLDTYYVQVFAPQASNLAVNTGPGGGFGVNAFFAKYFGLGVENFWYANDGSSSYFLLGNLYFRYPIEALRVAPYVVVGGGAGFLTHSQVGFGTVGGGLEYRVTRNIGLFTEGRYLFGMPNTGATLRSGVKFSF